MTRIPGSQGRAAILPDLRLGHGSATLADGLTRIVRSAIGPLSSSRSRQCLGGLRPVARVTVCSASNLRVHGQGPLRVEIQSTPKGLPQCTNSLAEPSKQPSDR